MIKEVTLKTKYILIGSIVFGLFFSIGYNMIVIQSLANQQSITSMELFAKMPALYFQMFICMFFAFSILFVLFIVGTYYLGLDKKKMNKKK